MDLVVKAVFHHCDDFLLFHVLADEDETHDAVTVLFVPNLLQLRIFFENASLCSLAFGGEPAAEILGACLLAGLFEQVAFAAFVAEPEETLGADDAVRIVVEERLELFAVQRTMVFEDERTDAVFVAMRMVLVMVVAAVAYTVLVVAVAVVFVLMVMIVIIVVVMVMVLMLVVVVIAMMVMMFVFVVIIIVVVVPFFVQLDCPGAGFSDLVEVELLCIEDVLHFDLAEIRLDHLGGRLQRLYNCLHVVQFLGCEAVHLVHDNRVAEFDLLDEQVRDIFFFEILVEEFFTACKFVGKAQNVDDCDNVVEVAGEALAVAALELAPGHADGLRYGNRFADAACFDEDVVELAHFEKFGDLFEQVRLEGAADAAVGKRNDFSGVFLGDVSALFDERLVNVDFANVVDDDGYMVALLVVKNVVEESRLAGSEVTGKERYRY